MPRSEGFTLIELLIVIAIIAILSVVVILVLNPAGLLQQSRDANRLSDMETLNTALGVYSEDVGTSFGNASTTYIDIADPTATSTAGDQCQGLGLPSLPIGLSYHCPASSTLRSSNGTGWLPVALSSISIGTPLSVLPLDPTNSISSNLYYSYNTNGSQFQLNAHFESQKYIPMEAASGGYDPAVYNTGNNVNIAPWAGGMLGYWPLNEGNGSSSLDKSGLGNNGIWNGIATGTAGTYYSTGNNQAYAGDFDGGTDYVTATPSSSLPQLTLSAWVEKLGPGSNDPRGIPLYIGINTYLDICDGGHPGMALGTPSQVFSLGGTCAGTGVWTNYAGTYNGSVATFYLNGVQVATANQSGSVAFGPSIYIGRYLIGYYVNGLIDDVRVYNRALSASEIAAIYAAGK